MALLQVAMACVSTVLDALLHCDRPPWANAAAPCSRIMVVVHGLTALMRRPSRATAPPLTPMGRRQQGTGEHHSRASFFF